MVTAKARTRLRKGIRALRQPMVLRGNEILTRWLADNHIEDNNLVITKIQGIFHVGNREDLCYQLGADEIVLGDFLVKPLRKATGKTGTGLLSKIPLIGKMVGSTTGQTKTQEAPTSESINTKQVYRLQSDENGANYKLASCCSPLPGDDVMGFIADDGKVEIHSLDCPQAQILKAGYGSRIVATEWAKDGHELFLAHVRIEGIDRRGILQEITQLISSHLGIDMRKLEIEASAEVFHADLWVRVSDADVVNDLCSRTKAINGVTRATRIH